MISHFKKSRDNRHTTPAIAADGDCDLVFKRHGLRARRQYGISATEFGEWFRGFSCAETVNRDCRRV